ncbi:MAG: thiamine-phosphate kinase [Nitrososphaera sp.]|jgi:thiamine-monophosphate kinase
MKKPDELEIIKIFQSKFGRKSKFSPEDVEIVEILDTKFIIKSDMLVQSTDVLPGMKTWQIARKSIVSCVSDFVCKGIRPKYATISLALPVVTKKTVQDLAKGFARASEEFGIRIIGGDVNSGKELVIGVSMFGTADKFPSRGGSKIGDIVITSGPFGYSSAGLGVLLHGYKGRSEFVKKCKENVMNPTPRFAFGLLAARYFSSSMDSSDGLSITLNDMSKQSGKKFVVKRLPTNLDVTEFTRLNRIDLFDMVFCGGEEFEIIATVSPKNLQKVIRLARKLNVPIFEIGHVTKGKGVVFYKDGRFKTIKRCGWIHLRS